MTSPSPSTGTKQTAAAATKECRTLIEQNPPVWAVNLFITSHCGPSPSKSPVGTRRALHGGFCHSRVYSLLSSSTLADSSSSRSLQSKTCSMQAVRPRSEAVGQRTTKRTAARSEKSAAAQRFAHLPNSAADDHVRARWLEEPKPHRETHLLAFRTPGMGVMAPPEQAKTAGPSCLHE